MDTHKLPNPPAAPDPSPAASSDGGELQQVTVTGYLIPESVRDRNRLAITTEITSRRRGNQTVSDVLQNLPAAVGNFLPAVTTGFSFSPGSASIGLKGLPPNGD